MQQKYTRYCDLRIMLGGGLKLGEGAILDARSSRVTKKTKDKQVQKWFNKKCKVAGDGRVTEIAKLGGVAGPV